MMLRSENQKRIVSKRFRFLRTPGENGGEQGVWNSVFIFEWVRQVDNVKAWKASVCCKNKRLENYPDRVGRRPTRPSQLAEDAYLLRHPWK